jgi:hypothetical protein
MSDAPALPGRLGMVCHTPEGLKKLGLPSTKRPGGSGRPQPERCSGRPHPEISFLCLRTRVAALTNHLTPYTDLHEKRKPPENTKRGGTTFTYPIVQWDRQHGSSQIAFSNPGF